VTEVTNVVVNNLNLELSSYNSGVQEKGIKIIDSEDVTIQNCDVELTFDPNTDRCYAISVESSPNTQVTSGSYNTGGDWTYLLSSSNNCEFSRLNFNSNQGIETDGGSKFKYSDDGEIWITNSFANSRFRRIISWGRDEIIIREEPIIPIFPEVTYMSNFEVDGATPNTMYDIYSGTSSNYNNNELMNVRESNFDEFDVDVSLSRLGQRFIHFIRKDNWESSNGVSTSNFDPGPGNLIVSWNDIGYAEDEEIFTSAESEKVFAPTAHYTHWLNLYNDEDASCDSIRFLAWQGASVKNCIVQIDDQPGDAENWETVYNMEWSGIDYPDREWFEVTFSERTVDQARIRFRYNGGWNDGEGVSVDVFELQFHHT